MKSEAKSICFIAAGLQGGGIERAFTGLANYYARKGITVYVVLLFKTHHFFTLDTTIKIVEPSLDRSVMNRFVYALRIIPYLRRNLKGWRPGVILSFGEWLNPFVILSTRGLGCPVFACERMSPDLNLGILLETAKKILYPLAAGIVVQTKYAAEVIRRKTFARNIKVIPNPLNEINVDTSRKKKQIVTVGRLSREKGHIFLIRAFARTQNTEWTLHIVGDGDQRRLLGSEAEKLGISQRVVFYGHQKDFSLILGESEIFVLPSLYEGFPNALIEAMSVPLPCISSNCVAGPPDIIEHGQNGLLVEPGNVDALTVAIEMLINNENLRCLLSRNAYAIRERLRFSTIAEEYITFINNN